MTSMAECDWSTRSWFNIMICVFSFMKTEGLYVPITYVTSAVPKGAVCLDGTPPAYHLDRGSGTGINSWLIHMEIDRENLQPDTPVISVLTLSFFFYFLIFILFFFFVLLVVSKGGGWCNNVETCLYRKNTRLGSSKKMLKQLAFSGILGNNPSLNPDFHNWNRVKIRYCDGSSFTGDVKAVNPVTKLHYRGARIWLAVMEELLAKGMRDAENALLSGCSAGGLTSILHCDSFRALLPMGTKVKCLSDAGFFVNVPDVSRARHVEAYFSQIVKLHGSVKNLPASCTRRSTRPETCFFPQYMAKQIRTPLFLLNAAYDSWQIKNILAPVAADPSGYWSECKLNIRNCSPNQIKIMQAFRLEFLSALGSLGRSSSRGLFINSCYAHCQTELQETWISSSSPKLSNKTIAVAVGDWFYDRIPFQRIDCPYPCDGTCQNMVFDPEETGV